MKATLIVTNLAEGLYWRETELTGGERDFCHQVNVYPGLRRQTFRGFGGAFTEAAARCWRGLPTDKAEEFLECYYGKSGLRYVLGRVPMGSSDFSVGNYSCVDSADEPEDAFRTAVDDGYLIPMIHAAQRVSGSPVGLVLSPWSPPGFMKTNGERNNGGKLLPEYRARWAECLARYAAHYRSAGCDVRLMTVQNESEAVQTWDSCVWTPQEEGHFAAEYLLPALKDAGCGDVGILAWDHNKEGLLRRAEGTLSVPGAAEAVRGFALHWYTGDHFDALRAARELWPDKELWFTEGCVEYGRFGSMTPPRKAEMYAHDILGNLNAGICGSIDWNLLLDAHGGPNHAGNYCEAPIMLTEAGDGFIKNSAYWYIGHFSRYIVPGSVRLASSTWTTDVECTAFEAPDSSLVLVLLNRTDAPLPISIPTPETTLNFPLAAHSIATVSISA